MTTLANLLGEMIGTVIGEAMQVPSPVVNRFCPLNDAAGEDIHINAHMGSWPVAVVGQYTGELVITNYRWCSCCTTGLEHVQGHEYQVFYH